MNFNRLGKHRLWAEVKLRHHHKCHEGCTRQQHSGFDDLHPGGRRHAAEQHINHHQAANDNHSDPILETEQQLDQLTRTDHLRDQIESHHDQGAGSSKYTHRGLCKAVSSDVGEGEATQITQALRHQKRQNRPAHQKSDRVDQAIESAHVHRS